MNIAYVKMDKLKKGIVNLLKYKINNRINKIYQDKDNKEIYYIYNTNKKTKEKLEKLLKNNKEDYAVVENINTKDTENFKMQKFDLKYPKLEGNYTLKYMLPEVIEYCYKKISPNLEELYICVNKYNDENVEIIKDLINRVKVVNIISSNEKYKRLETELEKKGIYIAVVNNKRNSLKKATILINLDFENLKQYNINRNMIIIDIKGDMQINSGFSGMYIKRIKIMSNKIMGLFSEFENFNKSELIEAEMINMEKYSKVRKYININKFFIDSIYGKRKIEDEEFKRLEISTNNKN